MTSSESIWHQVQRTADRAQAVADHKQAIDLYTQALAEPDIPWEARSAIRLARARSWSMLGEIDVLDGELSALAVQAAALADYATQSTALYDLAMALRFTGAFERGLQRCRQAVRAAKRVGLTDLEIGALFAQPL